MQRERLVACDDSGRSASKPKHRIKRLPVLDADDRLVGIVSRHDLVCVFVRPDNEIAAEIREDVLLRALCVAPSDFQVDVHDGVVALHGQLERRSMVALCRRVDGVIDVTGDLTFTLDDSKVDDATVAQNVGILHGMWGPTLTPGQVRSTAAPLTRSAARSASPVGPGPTDKASSSPRCGGVPRSRGTPGRPPGVRRDTAQGSFPK
jgi:hypothetical protein